MRTAMRVVGMIVGLVGTAIALILNILYSLAHVLGRISGISADSSHFFIGLGLTLVALVGSLTALTSPETSAVLLVIATIGFFFIMGWWALIIAPFLLVAAALVYLDRTRARTTALG